MQITVIAGEGFLPIEVIKELLKNQNFCNIIIFKNFNYNFKEYFTISELDKIEIFETDFRISFEIFKILKNIKCNKIVFCGKVHFNGVKSILPTLHDLKQMIKLRNLKTFFHTLLSIRKIFKRLNKGDDFLLSLLVSFFESNKVKVLSVDAILKDILCTTKDTTKNNTHYERDLKDGVFGVNILNNISNLDMGQSIVIKNGRILGIEAAEGTDLLIKRCATYLRESDENAVFCKSSKVNQNMKIDIAAIGCDTVDNLHKNNYKSVVLKEGKVLIVDKTNFLKKINQYKMNLIII